MGNLKLAFQVGKEIRFLSPDEILYCISDGNYTNISTKDGKKILTSKSLKDLEQVLNQSNFVRIHHASIVNIYHIIRYSKGKENSLEMTDGKNIKVSRRRTKHLLQYFLKL